LRLLLDEMYPTAIAEQLRKRGHDVSAVTERPELRSLPDGDVFAIAQRERRVVASENIGDFSSIAQVADQAGQPHFGLVLIDPSKCKRGQQRTIGRLVTEIDRLLKDHPRDDPTSARYWL
jgi:predicted nuclease of predicted toxin-antitoxin system